MKTIELKIIVTGILVICAIISGIWLSKLGRPLNLVIFNFHKIISLLALISTAITIYHLQKNAELRNLEIILIIVTALVFLIAFVTGALLSFDKPVNNTILAVHKVTPFLIVASGTLIIYMMARGK